MIDFYNFKRRSYYLDKNSSSMHVVLPLGIPAFARLLKDYKDNDEGLKMLTYVVNIAHYGSPSNIIGLTGKERKEDVCRNLGIEADFKESSNIKLAIKEYNKHYSKGVFGLFKQLNMSFEMTRENIEVINDSIKSLVKDIKLQQKAKTSSPDVILAKVKDVNSAISQIRELTTSLSTDIENLRTMEGLMTSEEAVQAEVYGGGYIPESARTND